ncbi:putative ABC transporter permease subunit [Haloimpatiens lingqiaonensis]|uniref:putative ABC transporter permease subunit n=1 Tax=Haloimpatiens lingqiaonensis TaxID=1380675 RepID=UPI0010FDAD04|nr:hypothetical protein [Haloimpatiens lingqiaonensis]
MSKCWLLIKIFLKTNKEGFQQNKKKSKFKLNEKLMYLILIIAFLPLAFMIGDMVSNFYEGLEVINQQGMILGIGFAISSLLIFFFGIIYCINTMYFAKDVENILPLPFKPWEIVTAKFVTILIYEYLTEAIFMIPIVVVYGIKSGATVLYYLYSTIVFLTLPIVPLVISSIIVMLIMSFTGLAKNKDRFRKFGGIFGLLLIVFMNSYMQKISQNSLDPNKLNQMIMERNNGFVNIVTKLFPSTKFAAFSAINSDKLSGLLNLLIFLCISILSMFIFNIIAEKLYFKGAIGISETSSKRKKLSSKEFSKTTIKQSTLMSYTKKELRILFRTPIYFYNCILMNFLWPVFFIIPMAVNSGKELKQFSGLGKYLNDPSISGIVIAVAFSVIIFVSGSNGITSTAISREGKDIYVSKYIPVSFKTQIMAKILSGAIMGLVSEIMMLIIVGVVVKAPIKIIIIILLLSFLAIAYVNMLGILIDLYHPKLNWENEQQAVKQNLNALFEMVISWVSIGVLMFLVIKFELDLLYTILLIIGLFGIIDLILYVIISSKGVKRFSKLGE